MNYIIIPFILLFISGCTCKTPEPTIVTKIVVEKVPVKCTPKEVEKPDFSKLNYEQKIYAASMYIHALEASVDSCK